MLYWKLNKKKYLCNWKRTKTRERYGFLATVRLHSEQTTTIREHLPWQQK